MGSSRSGGLTSYTKGSVMTILAQAVWARVIVRRALMQHVGSDEKKEEGASQH